MNQMKMPGVEYIIRNRLYVLKEEKDLFFTSNVKFVYYLRMLLRKRNYLKNLPINGMERRYKYLNSLRQ